MSEETKVAAEETKQEEKKVEYKINIAHPEDLNTISETAFMDSNELCAMVTTLFKAAFADCYGSTFKVIPGTNDFAIYLYFDHLQHDNGVTAVSKDADSDNTINSTLRRTRNYQNRLINGDRYHLTEEGKSALDEFMMDPSVMRKIYKGQNKNGKYEVNWDATISDVADPSYGRYSNQLTEVAYIDPNKIVAKIFGEGSDDKLEYGVRVLRSIPTFSGLTGNASSNFMLAIDRVSQKNVYELCNKFGIGYQPGLNIIK